MGVDGRADIEVVCRRSCVACPALPHQGRGRRGGSGCVEMPAELAPRALSNTARAKPLAANCELNS